jgi:hypothetical protein
MLQDKNTGVYCSIRTYDFLLFTPCREVDILLYNMFCASVYKSGDYITSRMYIGFRNEHQIIAL